MNLLNVENRIVGQDSYRFESLGSRFLIVYWRRRNNFGDRSLWGQDSLSKNEFGRVNALRGFALQRDLVARSRHLADARYVQIVLMHGLPVVNSPPVHTRLRGDELFGSVREIHWEWSIFGNDFAHGSLHSG